MITYNKRKDYTLVANKQNYRYTLSKTSSYSIFEITLDNHVIFKRESLKEKCHEPNLITAIRAMFLIYTYNLLRNQNEEQLNWFGSKNIHLYKNTGLFSLFVKLYFLTLIIRNL
jgi:hypothetical protein